MKYILTLALSFSIGYTLAYARKKVAFNQGFDVAYRYFFDIKNEDKGESKSKNKN